MQQQRFRRVAFFIGATTLAAGGLMIAACGTDNGNTATPQVEASSPRETGGGNPEAGPNPEAGDMDSPSNADCAKNPILRTTTRPTGFFCGFYNADGGDSGTGNDRNCPSDDTCCDPGPDPAGSKMFPPAYCAVGKGAPACAALPTPAPGTKWVADGGTAWECADKNSCPAAAPVCCLIQDVNKLPKTLNIGGYSATNMDHPPACNAKTAYNAGGTACRTACAAGEEKMCSLSDDTCGAGTKCTAFDALFRQLGYCGKP